MLVTRPEKQSVSLVERMQQLGLDARAVPLFSICALQPEVPAGRPDCLIFVSVNAVEQGLPWLQHLDLKGLDIFAIGPATVAALERYQLKVSSAASGFRSEDLLAAFDQQLRGKSCWVVCGEGGREALQENLSERESRVESLYCYRREPALEADRQLAELAESWAPEYISLMNGQAVGLFCRAIAKAELSSWLALPVLVPSPRVLAEARASGFEQALLLADASEETLCSFLLGLVSD